VLRHLISEAYYNRTSDKKAIAELLNFKDADKLDERGYAARFRKPQGGALPWLNSSTFRMAPLILAILRLRVGSILKSASGAKCS
jgi:hypothetical protein